MYIYAVSLLCIYYYVLSWKEEIKNLSIYLSIYLSRDKYRPGTNQRIKNLRHTHRRAINEKAIAICFVVEEF